MPGLGWLALAALAQDWPAWRGPDQDGSARESRAFSQPFELHLAWVRPLGSGYSGIVAAGGLAVTAYSDGTSDYLGAFALSDGGERWRVELGPTFAGHHGAEDGPSSTPCIRAGVVFAAGPRARFVAVRLSDGELLWASELTDTVAARVPEYGFGAAPLAVGEVVYLPVVTADGRSGLGFDPTSGAVRWSLPGAWVDYQSALRLEDTDLFFAVDTRTVALVDASCGESVYRFVHPGGRDLAYPQLTPVSGERLLFSYEGEALLYDLDLGREPPPRPLWRSRELKQCYAPPVVHGDAVYGHSGTFLACIDLDTGARLWKSREPGSRGLVLVDGHLVLFSTAGEVVVAEASRAGYRERARLQVGERGGYTPPSFVAGRILVRNTSTLACVEVRPAAGAAPAERAAAPDPLPASLARALDAQQSAQQHQAVVDAWWESQESFPVVEEGRVHFLYRGDAEDVALIGAMTAERYRPDALRRVVGTDLFHRSCASAPDGLWQYSFLVDFERVVLDPSNPRTAPNVHALSGDPQALSYAELSSESVVPMPLFPWPSVAERFARAAASCARLERVPFASVRASEARPLLVYRPPGAEGPLPVLYVIGGETWFELAGLGVALDAAMGTSCAPALVVGVPYHAGSADGLDSEEYFAMIRDDIDPVISTRYPVGHGRAVMGAADDGTAALALAFQAPERFARVAAQSPFVEAEDFALMERATAAPLHVYVDWSRHEARIGDENVDYRSGALRVVALLRERGAEVVAREVSAGPGFPSWMARIEAVLAHLLPRE
ncbi:MAG TPA: PQQ-binding-like beta-propeller repeat protein [Planctomycetota bacterium]